MGEMTAGSTAGSEVTTGAASTEKRVEKVADAFVFAFVVCGATNRVRGARQSG
jgi:hypothetical protein